MANKNNENLHILTEVGVFGDLDVDDPTAKKVNRNKNDDVDIDALIDSAIEDNMNNLSDL